MSEADSINPLLEVLILPIDKFLDKELGCESVVRTILDREENFVGFTGYLKGGVTIRVTVTR